ncbi:hypothetical protein CWI80_04245 [Pseudidiomarina sediminum]|uniref:Uncharacterized protein n=1 Tax=Pseudidiomarina sediminum TaxID=431675 RepID=A0A432Z9G1_9GAMM|nr:hypothetical protein [Pseudidiomarina sediminum]RUO74558.1 hypothetical protein CWI80_04245 [Pseudidiomarina sediminum]
MTSSQRNLLLIAAVLAALQFIVKPLLAWQEDVNLTLTLEQGRLERSEQLLVNAERVRQAANDAQAAQQTMLAQFPVATEATLTQIQLQGAIEAVFRKHGLRIEEFSWLTGLQPKNASLSQLRSKLVVSGAMTNIAQAHFELMQSMPTIAQEDIELRQLNRRGSRGGVRLTVMLNVAVQNSDSLEGASS